MDRIVTSRPPNYQYTRDCVYRLKGRYPFLDIVTIGQSVAGRDIFGLQIGSSPNKVLFCGGFHALEWLTSLLLLRFCEDLCHTLDTKEELAGIHVVSALKDRSLLVIPALNVDGIDIVLEGPQSAGVFSPQLIRIAQGDFSQWQANAHGVDLNHNFNAGFALLQQLEQKNGITGPAPRQYGGPKPHSEPETQALVALCQRENFRHALAFHSQGEEIFWYYGDRTPQKSILMAEILAASSGYSVSTPTGMASHGGFKDWFIEQFGKPGFTVEIGRGTNPLPLSELEPIYARLLEMLLLAMVM